MRTLYHPALNGGKASDWSRPIPCQREGDKLPKGPYQSSNGYSTRAHLPGHLACDPSSQREASHVSSQGKEAVFVTHDTLPEVVKVSALYYKNKKYIYKNHSIINRCRCLKGGQIKPRPHYDYMIG